MSQKLHEKIDRLIEESGKTREAVSRAAGLDKTYLRNLSRHPETSPRAETLAAIADVLGVPVGYLLDDSVPVGAEAGAAPPAGDVRPAEIRKPGRQSMSSDVPVLGVAAGSFAGAFQFEDGTIEFVRRPPALAGARDVYAIYVQGTSMEPRYEEGALCFVHPHRPARIGDYIVVQIRNHDSAGIEAMIGRLQARTGDYVVIGKLNPQAEVRLARGTVVAIHKVMDMNELFGV